MTKNKNSAIALNAGEASEKTETSEKGKQSEKTGMSKILRFNLGIALVALLTLGVMASNGWLEPVNKFV